MKNHYDAIVVGAGPAGLSCSTTLSMHGLNVALVDEQASPGGQIYRNIKNSSKQQRSVLGSDYTAGQSLVDEFKNSSVDYLSRARVWQADACGDVFLSRNNASRKLSAKYLVLSTGAMERPVPFPGWILPGVMTCGGISNLFKDAGMFPNGPIVLAGSGPLFWLSAKHLFDLKVAVTAILDTAPANRTLGALKHMPAALQRPDYLFKGVSMIAGVKLAARKKGVPIYNHVTDLQAHGTDELERVTAKTKGKTLDFEVSSLLVHEGVIPNTALLRQVGCEHAWNPVQRYWYPKTDTDGRTHFSRVFVAGDGGFVHGARPAEIKGRLAGLAIAQKMNCFSKPEHEKKKAGLSHELKRELYARPFVDALYLPGKHLYAVSDDTIVCRCEGITAGRIRGLVDKGLTDHNEIKSIIRCGMGPCQGRMCGPGVLEVVAQASGTEPADTRPLRIRPPIKPVSLQEMANAQLGGESHDN